MISDNKGNKTGDQRKESGSTTGKVTPLNSPVGKGDNNQDERSPKKPKVTDIRHIDRSPKPYTKNELDAEKDNDDGVRSFTIGFDLVFRKGMGFASLQGPVPQSLRKDTEEFLKSIITSSSDDTVPYAEFIQDAQYTTEEDVMQTTVYLHPWKSALFECLWSLKEDNYRVMDKNEVINLEEKAFGNANNENDAIMSDNTGGDFEEDFLPTNKATAGGRAAKIKQHRDAILKKKNLEDDAKVQYHYWKHGELKCEFKKFVKPTTVLTIQIKMSYESMVSDTSMEITGVMTTKLSSNS